MGFNIQSVRQGELIMSKSLQFSTECEECEEELTPNRDNTIYTCDECGKEYFYTDLYTY